MLIFASASKLKENNDKTIAQAIITGFTSQLQGWWDFYISKEAKYEILNATIRDTISLREESDAVNTLIFTILSHFVGANELQLDKSQSSETFDFEISGNFQSFISLSKFSESIISLFLEYLSRDFLVERDFNNFSILSFVDTVQVLLCLTLSQRALQALRYLT